MLEEVKPSAHDGVWVLTLVGKKLGESRFIKKDGTLSPYCNDPDLIQMPVMSSVQAALARHGLDKKFTLKYD